ncbi:hypothetical protein Tco_0251115 [Tanacetum coccineum]
MAQFWHTLKEDGSKHRLKFLLDRKELTLTLDDFRTIFHLPKANDTNHASFVPPPSFSDMVPFYKQVLGLQGTQDCSNFKIPVFYSLADVMQDISKCLTTLLRDVDQTAVADNANVETRTRQSARLTPSVLVPTAEKVDEVILQDTIQVSLAEHKSRKEQEAMRKGGTSIGGDCFRQNIKNTKYTEVDPDKDTPMVDVTNIVTPVNVDDEEDEITVEVFELRRRVKGKNVEETRISPIPSLTRSPRNLFTLISSDTEILQ